MQKYREFIKIVDEVNEHRLIDNEKMRRLRKKMRENPESVVDNRYYLQWVSSYVGIPYEPLNNLIKKTLEDKDWGEYYFNQDLLKIIRSYIK